MEAVTESSTLSELMLAAEYADQMEAIHQKRCRTRGMGLDCVACQERAADVLRTDIDLRHFWASRKEGAA